MKYIVRNWVGFEKNVRYAEYDNYADVMHYLDWFEKECKERNDRYGVVVYVAMEHERKGTQA